MRILSVQPACPTSLEDRVASAQTLCDVLEVVRPLAYHADCLVSLQRCREAGTEVAVKSYPKMKLSKLAREQVDNEAYIHGSLIHDHIVPLLLAAEDERNIHLVVQWADGGDLREHILGIGEQRLKEFVVQPLLSALAVLDSQGVVHRDLKPDNVLVHKGSVRLSDFGLAVYHNPEHQGTGHESSSNPSFDGSMTMCASMTDVVLSCASSMPASCRSSFSALDTMHDGIHHQHAHSSTSVSDEQMHEHQRASRHPSLPCLLMRRPASSAQIMSNVGGTPMYTAPEVLRAMFQSQPISDFVSPKNDVWALGIMILEALTGCHPYSSGSTCVTGSMYSCNLLYAVAHHKGFKYPAHLSAGAVDFLKAALHVDPAQRPSAMELLSHPWLQPASSSTPQTPASACKNSQGGLSVRVTADGGPVGASPRGSAGGARGCTTPVSCKASLGAALRAVDFAPRISSGCFEY